MRSRSLVVPLLAGFLAGCATALPPHVPASFAAISTSKPVILPLVVASSIGGNVGSVQYLKVVALRLAPAVPAAARATSRASRGSMVNDLRIGAPP